MKRIHIKFPFAVRGSKMAALVVGFAAISATVACTELQNIDPAVVQGILQNVDSISGEVTVQLNDGTTTTFNLEDVNVGTLQAVAGSAVLQAGDEIELTFDANDAVTSLSPSTAKVEGIVVSVDTDALTVTIESENGIVFTVNVAPSTEIEVEKPGSSTTLLADISAGMEVEVKYNPETLIASKIEAETIEDDEDRDREIEGVVSAIDNAAVTISVVDDNGGELTFFIVPSTEIDNEGPATFSAIQIGDRVEVEYVPQTMVVLEIEIEEAEEPEDEDEDDEDDEDEDDEEDEDE